MNRTEPILTDAEGRGVDGAADSGAFEGNTVEGGGVGVVGASVVGAIVSVVGVIASVGLIGSAVVEVVCHHITKNGDDA